MRDFWHRLSRWDKALLALVSVYLLLWPLEPHSRAVLTGRVILQIAIYFTGSVVLLRHLVRGVRAVLRHFLWRVRHRLIAVYLFVGFIPLTLAFLLAGLGLYLLIGPFAAYIVTSRIEQRAESLYATATSLGWQLGASPPAQRRETAIRFLEDAAQRFPGIMARFETPRGAAGFPQALVDDAPPGSLKNSQAIVEWNGRLHLAANAQYGPDSPSVLLMVPLTTDYMAGLMPGLGPVEIGPSEVRVEGNRAAVLGQAQRGASDPGADQVTAARPGTSESAAPGPLPQRQLRDPGLLTPFERARLLPPPAHPFDYAIPWPAQVPVLSWGTGEAVPSQAFILRTRPSAVARLIFSNQSPRLAESVRVIGYFFGGMFVLAVLVSLVIALSLTRTLTQAVHQLYVATLHVNRGDFSHRIALRGENQLTDLGRSFNVMTASIERLVVDSRERERLQSELEIAREVQSQLFPRKAPQFEKFEVLGVCHPAQTVSGDFYDYVQLSPSRLALALGDVSGKGISAALVMAAVHSIVRTQLSVLAHMNGQPERGFSTADLVARVNDQLHEGTSSEKFATLFFATYEETSGVLSYSNAGHLPPLLIRGGQARRLNVDGMVVGAFADSAYQSSVLDLCSGDVLVAYTDGITEPENPYGEEFGEQRLIEVLLRESDRPVEQMIDAVIREVMAWTGQSSLQDDMTVLVARRR